ncbi:conjugal transfer protein [Enterococcus hirae]|uniref:conjugal transfer protein n=1 Tax=Enterococcus hirae TaxID=1354 RepID=UPI00137881D2|nr:conjugal transfer protein [Enterococcus hirae]NBA54946.1 conjugal transfer protein [Enterococcus hirae]
MAERKPIFNPQTVTSKKEVEKKETAKNKRLGVFKQKNKVESNTRTIRFAPRTAQSVVSFLFFSLFLVMCVVVLMTFGRVDTLSRIAVSKQVNKEELITNVNNALKDTEQLRYEGMKLADRLFTISHKENGKKYWEEQLAPFLATGLNPNDLGFSTTSVDRIARNVRFIKMDTVDEKKALYRLYYDVRFTEGDTWQQVQIILPVSYEGQEIKLIDRPFFTNLATTEEKNKSIYQENRFTPKGSEVKDEEKDKVIEFTQRFFELYVTNDEKLALIANIQGLGKAKLVKVEPKKVLKTDNGNYYVQGVYTFVFDESNPLTSNFMLEIKPTKESYYVTKMNGE